MEFSGTQTIAAPIDKVWAFLMDVNNVASCAPGFQSLEVLGEEHWKAVDFSGCWSKAKSQ
jgi:carbon monoxide dehydrogenase subunit G